MSYSSGVVALSLALLSDATPTVAQGLPTPEQRAFAAVDDARHALEAASGAAPMLDAAQALLDRAESAYRAFSTADRHRDAASERLPGRWNCEPVPSNDPVYIIANRNANWATGVSTDCEATAAYAEAAGFVRASDGQQLATRLRRLANRFRGVQTSEQHRAVLAPATSVCSACSALHSRATEAHIAANRTALVSLGRATRAIATAAGRLTVQDYPGTRATEVLRAVQAANRAVAAATHPQAPRSNSRTDTALESLIGAARVTVTIARAHRAAVEQVAQRDEEQRRAADGEPVIASPEVSDYAGLEEWQNSLERLSNGIVNAFNALANEDEIHNCQDTLRRLTERARQQIARMQPGAGPRFRFVPNERWRERQRDLNQLVTDVSGQAENVCARLPADASMHRPGVTGSWLERRR